jgi:hypothetical protein
MSTAYGASRQSGAAVAPLSVGRRRALVAVLMVDATGVCAIALLPAVLVWSTSASTAYSAGLVAGVLVVGLGSWLFGVRGVELAHRSLLADARRWVWWGLIANTLGCGLLALAVVSTSGQLGGSGQSGAGVGGEVAGGGGAGSAGGGLFGLPAGCDAALLLAVGGALVSAAYLLIMSVGHRQAKREGNG